MGVRDKDGQTVGRGSHPLEEGWAEPCDSPEFRRFLDLRVDPSVGLRIWL